jgi:hypothetical protein
MLFNGKDKRFCDLDQEEKKEYYRQLYAKRKAEKLARGEVKPKKPSGRPRKPNKKYIPTMERYGKEYFRLQYQKRMASKTEAEREAFLQARRDKRRLKKEQERAALLVSAN